MTEVRIHGARPMRDAGFAELTRAVVAARGSRLVRRIALRGALDDVCRPLQALIDLIDETRKPGGGERAALVEQAVRLAAGDEVSGAPGLAVKLSEGDTLREDELLECAKVLSDVLGKIQIGLRHGLFSGVDGTGVSDPSGSDHRLCGGAK